MAGGGHEIGGEAISLGAGRVSVKNSSDWEAGVLVCACVSVGVGISGT